MKTPIRIFQGLTDAVALVLKTWLEAFTFTSGQYMQPTGTNVSS